MAINLNPGADATLVNAAYKAAVSTAPGDYSRTLERAADSYEKTMEAQSKTLGSIAALGAAIGGEMVANANELSAKAAVGAGLDVDGAKFVVEELYANKDAQKELRGINFLQSRETRQKRQELKLEQRELFADIDNAAESIRLGSEAVAAGTFKVLRGNEKEAEMVNAIIKSNLKDKVTGNKNIARLGRDEKTGELMYTMYDAESGGVSMVDGVPQTMTIKQFNKAITTNVDDKGIMKGKLNTVNDASANSGNESLNGVYAPEIKQMHLNQLDDIVKTDTDLQRAFGEKFGYSNSSFLEDIQRPSNLSMWVYNDLLSVTGAKDGVLADSELTKGIIDIDGKAGISQEDLQNDTNYGILAENILGMKNPEVSKALFKEYTIDKFEAAHKFGYSQKTTKPPTPFINYNDPNEFSYLNKSGNIGFLNKSNDGKTYVSGADAKTKLDEIRGAKKGDIITHWEGSNTVRYVKTEFGMFIQEKYNAEKGGFEAEQDNTRQDYGKQMTTEDVEKDMNFPNAMLQTKVKVDNSKI